MTNPKLTFVHGHRFPRSPGLSDVEELNLKGEAEAARKRFRKIKSRYARAVESGDKSRISAVRRQLTGSSAFRLACAVAAETSRPVAKRQSLVKIKKSMEDCNWGSVPAKPAKLFAQIKSNGKPRPVWDFPIQARAIQKGIWVLIKPHFKPKAWQHEWFGGVRRSIRSVAKEIESGKTWAAELDVQNCHGSFNKDLEEVLPLPKGITNRFVLGEEYGCDPTSKLTTTSSFLVKARQGLPQGSLHAAIVSGHVFSKLNWKGSVCLNHFVDNFCLLGTSQAEVDANADALVDAVKQLPGGTFSLKKRAVVDLTENPIVYLGHKLKIADGKSTIRPAKLAEHYYALHEVDEDLSSQTWLVLLDQWDRLELLDAASASWRGFLSWRSAFSECDDDFMESLKAEVVAAITSACSPVLTWQEIKGHSPKSWNVTKLGSGS